VASIRRWCWQTGTVSVRLAYSMSPHLPNIWMWGTRVYALLCVGVIIAVTAFHAAYPQYQGIPWWLFVLVQFPALGIEILPVIFVIDVVLAVKGVYRRRTFFMQAIILVIAFCFCLQGLRQSPPPPPESGITVRGACKNVLPALAGKTPGTDRGPAVVVQHAYDIARRYADLIGNYFDGPAWTTSDRAMVGCFFGLSPQAARIGGAQNSCLGPVSGGAIPFKRNKTSACPSA